MRTTHRPLSSFRNRTLIAALASALAPGALAATFTVMNAASAGTDSLNDVMARVQAACPSAPHTINFNIPGTGPFVITPSGPLPQLTCSVDINGTSQTGWAANTDPAGFNATLPIVVDGSSQSSPTCGIRMIGGGTLRGVDVRNFDYGGGGSGICGNMTVQGSVSQHNDKGISVEFIDGATIGNGSSITADRNLIHSNARAGIVLSYGGSVVIQNNHIVNNQLGVDMICESDVQIRDKNTISGNVTDGVHVSSASNVSISDSSIDTNGANGILIGNQGCGDSTAGQVFNNRITGNTLSGVKFSAGSHQAVVQGNSIYSNNLKNINLNFDGGVLNNDTGDADSGPNGLQNHPVPTAATNAAGTTTVNYTFDSTPGTYTFQAFANSADTGKPAGETLMPSIPTVTVSGGPITSSFTVAGTFNHISLLATNITSGFTSELSPQVIAVGPAACVVTTAADSGTGSLRDAINKANSALCTGNQITFNIPSPPYIAVLATPLPAITAGVLIDGTTQSSQKPGVDGTTVSAANTGCSGLNFFAAGTVRGLVVRNFTNSTDGSGLCGRVTALGNDIQGNNRGIDADGGTIGGTTAGDGNLITGNQKGIFISTTATVNVLGNAVTGNTFGLYTDCASGGGVVQSNDFSGNTADGLWLRDAVGFSINANAINSNGGEGIYIGSISCTGSRNNTIDGNNTITGNGKNGIVLKSDASNGNEIGVNSIHGNALKNIDLNFPGGTLPNDDGDPDVGPNRLQNHPVITSLGFLDGSIFVNFQLKSAPSSTFRVRAFANDSAAKPAGKQFAGDTDVTTDATGVATGSINAGAPPRNNFSLTATETTTHDTSEFSPIFSIPTAIPTPIVFLSSNAMSFGNVTVDTSSAPQTVSLTSAGSAPYRISAIGSDSTCATPMCAAGDFQCSTTCVPGTDYPASTAPSCTVTGQFNPKTTGPASTKIFICDNTGPGSQQITLSGNGIAPPPPPPPPPPQSTLEITPATHDFGRVLVGQGAQAEFMIINHAQVATSLGVPQVTGNDFALLSTTCGSSLPPVSACYARVGFIPSQATSSTGTLEVGGSTSSAPDRGKSASSAKADLTGTGFSAASMSLPAAIDFGTFTLGSTPLRRTVTVTNTGNAVLTFSTVSVAGPFTLANNCPLNLAAGASCELVLDFTTTTVGEFTGTLNVVANGEGSRAIALTARSQRVPAPVIVVTPVAIGFGNQMIGSRSDPQGVTVRNNGGAPATLGALNVSDDFVIVHSSCGATLAPNADCLVEVAMQPQGFGQRSGRLLVNSNAVGSPHGVDMVGSGCRPFFFGGNRVGPALNCAP